MRRSNAPGRPRSLTDGQRNGCYATRLILLVQRAPSETLIARCALSVGAIVPIVSCMCATYTVSRKPPLARNLTCVRMCSPLRTQVEGVGSVRRHWQGAHRPGALQWSEALQGLEVRFRTLCKARRKSRLSCTPCGDWPEAGMLPALRQYSAPVAAAPRVYRWLDRGRHCKGSLLNVWVAQCDGSATCV